MIPEEAEGHQPLEQVNEKRHPVLRDVRLGVGTWAWGDRLIWGYGSDFHDEDLHGAFKACLAGGLHFFDTAEVYGQGHSETLLGKFAKEAGQPVTIATKFMPFPWRLGRSSLTRALRGSLQRMGRQQVELYQIHLPMPPITIETWMEMMIEAQQAGLIGAVGVSNFNRTQMLRAYDTLIRQGISLASNQVEYSLLDRKVERDGLLKLCQEMGITLIAYSPLAMGLLTGKYSAEAPPPGMRGGRISHKYLQRIQSLISLVRRIGAEHEGRPPAQVALNWVIAQGALPIVGVKNAEQAEQNAATLEWQLTSDEIAELNEMSDRVTEQLSS